MTTRTWASKLVERTPVKAGEPEIRFFERLVMKEHARSVRIVKAEIKRVRLDQHSYSVVTKGELLASLNKLLAALQRGRARSGYA